MLTSAPYTQRHHLFIYFILQDNHLPSPWLLSSVLFPAESSAGSTRCKENIFHKGIPHSTKSPLSLQKVPPAKADNSILLWNIHSSGYSKNNSKSSPLAYPLHISDYPLSSASCFALLSNSSNLLSSSAPTRIQQYRLTAMTTAAPPIIIPIISIHLFRPSVE